MPGMVQDIFAIFMVEVLAGEMRKGMHAEIMGCLRQRVLNLIAHCRNDVEQLAIITEHLLCGLYNQMVYAEVQST